MPRELKHFQSQCKSSVNVFGRNMLPQGTRDWPADTVNYFPKKNYCKEGHKQKLNDLPSPCFPDSYLHLFLKHCHTSPFCCHQNAIFSMKPFLITGMTLGLESSQLSLVYPIHLFNIHLLHACHVLGILLDTGDKVMNKTDTNSCIQGAYLLFTTVYLKLQLLYFA